MDKIVGLVSSAPQMRSAMDDDFSDRLSSRYTVALLVSFAVLVSMNQYVRNPITCWSPVHFTGAHTKFATNYCWVKNTYYLPWDHELPHPWERDKRHVIPYYQWIPFILLGQALLFYIPTIIWHGLNQKAGVDADNIMAAAHTFSRVEKVADQDRTKKLLRNQFDRFLTSHKRKQGCHCDIKSLMSNTCCLFCGTRLGNYLIGLFLFSKLCYIGNVIGQLFLLNAVLKTKYNTFGPDMVKQLLDDETWTDESFVAFPRVTFCDFQIRGQDVGNTQFYTIQCVLPINLFNEKIYMFLWFWMAVVAAISVMNFCVWLIRCLVKKDRIQFIRNHLLLGERITGKDRDTKDGERKLVQRFLDEYLRQDGAFLMRLIAHNCNSVVTTEIICSVWDFWKEKQPDVDDIDPPYRRLTPSSEGTLEKQY